jgi:hypothetical protein
VLLLAAFGTTLARPFSQEPAPPYLPPDAVIVIDVSASMQALEGGASRFSLARDAAKRLVGEIARATPERRFGVVTAGLHPSALGSGLAADEAIRILDSLVPLDTAGNPTAAIELAVAQVGPAGAVHLFGDTPLEGLVLSRDARSVTTVHRFGTSDQNAAIVGVRVLDNRFEDQASPRVLVTVKNFSQRSRQALIEIVPLGGTADPGRERSPTENGASTRSGPAVPGATRTTIRLRREVLLEPRESVVVSFDEIGWAGSFQVTLGPPDDLAVDNVAYGHVAQRERLRVLLVTDDVERGRELEDLARRLGNLSVTIVAPAVYRPAIATDVTLFDRFVPPFPPPGNVAYLAPRQGNGEVAIVGTTSDTRFAEVRDHELLAGVQNPETLLSSSLVGLASGGPLRPVLLGRAEGREAALVVAGTVGARRVVATAFPLRVRSRDPDQLPSLIFTLNLLRWLAPPARGAPLERLAGDMMSARFPDATAIARLEGAGRTRNLAPAEEIVLDHAGVYRATGPEESRDLLVNFADPGESDIGRPALAEEASARSPGENPDAAVAPAPRLRVFHTRDALVCVAALMLAEWSWIAWIARHRAESDHA